MRVVPGRRSAVDVLLAAVRTAGAVLAVLGLAALVYAAIMDTTVTTSDRNLVRSWGQLLLVGALVVGGPAALATAFRRGRREDLDRVG